MNQSPEPLADGLCPPQRLLQAGGKCLPELAGCGAMRHAAGDL